MLSNAISLTRAKRKKRIRISFRSIDLVPSVWIEQLRPLVKLFLKMIGLDFDRNKHAFLYRNASKLMILHCLSHKDSSSWTVHSQSLFLNIFQINHFFQIIEGNILSFLSDNLVNFISYSFLYFWMLGKKINQNSCHI